MTTIADRLRGIHAATIVPMTAGFAIDEARLAEHIAAVSHVPGIRGCWSTAMPARTSC